jgi:hypothetical protein
MILRQGNELTFGAVINENWQYMTNIRVISRASSISSVETSSSLK